MLCNCNWIELNWNDCFVNWIESNGVPSAILVVRLRSAPRQVAIAQFWPGWWRWLAFAENCSPSGQPHLSLCGRNGAKGQRIELVRSREWLRARSLTQQHGLAVVDDPRPSLQDTLLAALPQHRRYASQALDAHVALVEVARLQRQLQAQCRGD